MREAVEGLILGLWENEKERNIYPLRKKLELHVYPSFILYITPLSFCILGKIKNYIYTSLSVISVNR
jgi:hypothetical protein